MATITDITLKAVKSSYPTLDIKYRAADGMYNLPEVIVEVDMVTPSDTFSDEDFPFGTLQKSVDFDVTNIGLPSASIAGTYSSYFTPINTQNGNSLNLSFSQINHAVGFDNYSSLTDGDVLATVTVSLTHDSITKSFDVDIIWEGDDYCFFKLIKDDNTAGGTGLIDSSSSIRMQLNGSWSQQGFWSSRSLNTVYTLQRDLNTSAKLKVIFNNNGGSGETFNYKIKKELVVKDQVDEMSGSAILYWNLLDSGSYTVYLEITDEEGGGPEQ